MEKRYVIMELPDAKALPALANVPGTAYPACCCAHTCSRAHRREFRRAVGVFVRLAGLDDEAETSIWF
ncbi:hypothetical protein OKW46_001226 [Paraburkholderia sp. WSM4179]|nr:hypothetical protein [Paraburkholderia sp. WSM4179]